MRLVCMCCKRDMRGELSFLEIALMMMGFQLI